MQLPQKEVDLYTFDYFDREFSILNGKYKFEFERIEDWPMDELNCWLKQKDLIEKYGILKSIGINGIEDLHKFDINKLSELVMSQQQLDYIKKEIEAELQEQEDNLTKRYKEQMNNGKRQQLEYIKIKIFKENMKSNGKKHDSKARDYIPCKEFIFDGLKDFVFCSADVNE